MDLVPYQRGHLDTFEPGAWDVALTRDLRAIAGWEELAVSMRENGKTLGVVGIAKINSTAHVWLVLSEAMRRRPIALTRMARASLTNIETIPGIRCVEISVDPMFDAGWRWAERLGFKAVNLGRMVYGDNAGDEQAAGDI